ncbi:hypothetical protein BJV74DRAFT_823285 [Russula compacta]|nr:hypothetical protein BJV74DRAFT_823285 [Russula compacta]
MSSSQPSVSGLNPFSRTLRVSKVERVGDNELQAWAKNESCQSDPLHRVDSLILGRENADVSWESSRLVKPPSKPTFAILSVLSFSVRPMNWWSCETSKVTWWKRIISNMSSRGASTRDMKSSKYSLTPWKMKSVRAGRTACVSGCGCWLALSGRCRGDRNLSANV